MLSEARACWPTSSTSVPPERRLEFVLAAFSASARVFSVSCSGAVPLGSLYVSVYVSAPSGNGLGERARTGGVGATEDRLRRLRRRLSDTLELALVVLIVGFSGGGKDLAGDWLSIAVLSTCVAWKE